MYGRCQAGAYEEPERDTPARERDNSDNYAQKHTGYNEARDLHPRGQLL